MMDDIGTKGFQGSLEECRSNDDRGVFASDGEQIARCCAQLESFESLEGDALPSYFQVCC